MTIPKRGAQHDYAALNACAAKLKASNPAYAEEEQVYIGANPGTDYQTIISVIDALRTTPDGKSPLFSNVNFKVAQ